MKRLAARSDVLVENFRPGVLDRLGLGYADLATLNPGLVYCSISAYGRIGPDAGKPGFGILAEAQSGVMSLVGLPDEKPPVLRLAVADGLTGAHAVGAVCAALYGRQATGRHAHRDEILERIEAWTMAQSSVAACLERLEEAGVPAAPVQSVDQMVADPQVKERGLLVEQEHPVLGKTELPGVPIRFAEGPLTLERAPLLGEHNRQIARALGYADPEIAALERAGVLYSDPAPPTES